MRIFIDADACPRPAKELVFRASARLRLAVVMVADRPLARPASPLVSTVVVPRDMDSADQRIAQEVKPGDLVITADVPLAAQVVELGATALDPRGHLLDRDSVGERLSMRDFLMALREGGQDLGGPAPYDRKDRVRFAGALDRFLSRRDQA